MVTICAWCQRYLGTKEPLADPSLTHGICKTCALRQQLAGSPTLVISRERAQALPFLLGLERSRSYVLSTKSRIKPAVRGDPEAVDPPR